MKIIIIIPTYNRKFYLKKLLDQLAIQIKEIEYNIKIITVVDGSTDGTIELLNKEFPFVHIVYGDGNWWYTKSMNEGFKFAQQFTPDFILTLNDDIELDNNYLKKILQNIDKNKIYGSLTVTKDIPHRIISSGIKSINKCTGKTKLYHKFLQIVDFKHLKGIHPTVSLPGRGMLIPNHILKELNFFDEKFPQYHSDADFCLRAQKKGYGVYINWEAKIYSYHQLTSKSTSFIKQSTKEFIRAFFNPYSRNHLIQKIRFFLRHYHKICFPLIFTIWLLLKIKHQYFKFNT